MESRCNPYPFKIIEASRRPGYCVRRAALEKRQLQGSCLHVRERRRTAAFGRLRNSDQLGRSHVAPPAALTWAARREELQSRRKTSSLPIRDFRVLLIRGGRFDRKHETR